MTRKPTIGALMLYYLLALGMFVLFGPSAYFYLNKVETNGIVYKIESSYIHVKYKDDLREDYLAKIEVISKENNLNIGEEVSLYYRKGKPTDVHVPDLHGKEPYFLYYIFLLMALFAVFIMQTKYLKK